MIIIHPSSHVSIEIINLLINLTTTHVCEWLACISPQINYGAKNIVISKDIESYVCIYTGNEVYSEL